MSIRCNSVFRWIALALFWIGWRTVAAEVPWRVEEWKRPPEVFPADGLAFDFPVPASIRPIFFAGPPFEGRPTRIFAWLGIPEHASGRLPAMVLVHGGGGSAFAAWVEYWNRRGYVAIAIDTGGCIPTAAFEGPGIRRGHDRFPGPGDAIFDNSRPISDRWPYHAVAAVILADSLLRSLPEVDPDRIGVTGISWGAVLTCIAAALDDRFRLAVPVYGCGFIRELRPLYGDTPQAQVTEWSELWDPEYWLPRVKVPMLFVNGAADPAFALPEWERTIRLPAGPVSRSLHPELPHCHRAGMVPEVWYFADTILKREGAWPELLEYHVGDGKFTARWSDGFELARAELIYSPDSGNGRRWLTVPGTVTGDGRVEAAIPEGTRACWLNVITIDGMVVSTPWTVFEP